MAKEKNLTAVTSVAAADFARVVTSAGASVKATFANVAKYIVETYNGSTVAGSAQSVKSALDSLNSNVFAIPVAAGSSTTKSFTTCAFVVIGRKAISSTPTIAFVDQWNGIIEISSNADLDVTCANKVITVTNNFNSYANCLIVAI